MSCNLFTDDIEKALPAAMAIEVFHNFTLLHDDIMDNAELRRNQPTVHLKFGENTAILSGDVMSFISFRYLLKCNTPRIQELLELFTETAVEVCEGQQYDMDFENRLNVSANEYLNMIRLKTAVLLGCSLKAGALVANTDDKTAGLLYELGTNLGIAFQLQDDLLDIYGNENTFGKKIGGDIVSNKKTFLLIKAMELAHTKQKQELMNWIENDGPDQNSKINAVISIFDQLGIKLIVVEKIAEYIEKAGLLLHKINVADTKKIHLQLLLKNIKNRDY
jgi:geranylgeranyl diphosphate synthase type II